MECLSKEGFTQQSRASSASNVGLQHPITCALAGLRFYERQRLLLHMADVLPRTLEGLLCCALPPAAVEVLLEGFDSQADDPRSSGGICSD